MAGHQPTDSMRITAPRMRDNLRGDLGGHPKAGLARRVDPRAIVVIHPWSTACQERIVRPRPLTAWACYAP